MARTLVFYCNALDDGERHRRGITTDSPAATRKVIGLCQAVRTARVRPLIVSMGRGQARGGSGYHRPRAGRVAGVAIVYGPMSERRGLSQLLTVLWLMAMAWRLRRREEAVHLFYNQLVAYLPAMLLLRLTGRRTAVDIEDGAVQAGGYRSRFGDASPRLFAPLVSGGALLACTALARGTPIRPVMPYYGALPYLVAPRAIGGDAVEVLYSGYLGAETGVELLAGALELLAYDPTPELRRLRINVTGSGPGLALLAELETSGRAGLRVHGRLDLADYEALVRRCHVGLSLKLRGGALADSTFPSKTVEFAQHGLAIVATEISDVRRLFGEAACYIERDDPGELAAILRHLAARPDSVAQLAAGAQQVVAGKLAMAAAGRTLASFLFDGDPA